MQLVDPHRRGREVGALDVGDAQARRPRRARADAQHLRAARLGGAGGGERAQRGVAGLGQPPPAEKSTGERSGAAISCAAEIAERQSSWSTTVTAGGRVSGERAG